MGNKYYTPDISEFHVGFEYESNLQDEKWEKETFEPNKVDDSILINMFFSNIKEMDCYRVKHLDQQDIEECGWNQVEYDTYKFQDFYLEFNNEYKTFIYEKKSGQENIVFKGIINNKSELKKLMQQLEIIK